jgi:hypothetical protein
MSKHATAFAVFVGALVLGTFSLMYIQRAYVDVYYLDGLMQVPNLEKYYAGTLTFQDVAKPWGEHRLIAYTLMFLLNARLLGLNAVAEPYWFLFTYALIAGVLYFPFAEVFRKAGGNRREWRIAVAYIAILYVIFGLTHPPFHLMTTQFVFGTFLFVVGAIMLDRMSRDLPGAYLPVAFVIVMALYIGLFSGAYFGGALLATVGCVGVRLLLERKVSARLIVAVGLTLMLMLAYILSTRVTLNDVSLGGKLSTFFSRPSETFMALLAGLSASNLDQHAFAERLGGNTAFVVANGAFLLVLGGYASYRFVVVRMFRYSYLPLLLMLYTVGTIFTIRLGRLDGGWLWPMSAWYSFHLMYYLIGLLWILAYDLLVGDGRARVSSRYTWTHRANALVAVAGMVGVVAVQTYSNFAQYERAPDVRQWLEVKRQIMLDPAGRSLEPLLWDDVGSLHAIEVLKKHRLSVFRAH